MANGIFTLRNQLLGLVQKAWTQPPTYAGVFNGTNQYLSTPTSTNLNLGTSSFTLEYWINTTSYTSAIVPISGGGSAATYDPQFGYGHAPMWMFLSSTGSSWDIANGQIIGTTVLNQWYHVAIVRSGSTFYTFLNGVQGATFTSSASIYQSTNAFLIGQGQGNQFVNGQVSNVRFVKGTALYTANFTPPTSPLTAVSGTQLLTLQNSTIIDNSANAFTIINNGSTTTQQAFPFKSSSYATPAVEYLVVAGGGSGAGNRGFGGGGGAGGLLQGLLPIILGSSYTVTIGAGGVDSSSANGGVGGNSAFGAISASGGGTGGEASASASGYPGGSGGGGGNSGRPGGSGVLGQGNYGGTGYVGGSPYGGGGGGGAGTVGLNATSAGGGGNGGAGIASAISGIVVAYAGGGGGAAFGTVQGTGGVGGGGAGSGGSAAPTAGTANTGGGGGSDGRQTQGGNGGSGIAIISYPDTYNAPASTTGTYTASTSGSGSVYFDGSSYLTIPNATNLQVGTSDFTIECWVYLTSTTGEQTIFAKNNNTGVYDFDLEMYSGNFWWNWYDGSSVAHNIQIAATANVWTHLAISKIGNVFTFYKNGVSGATATVTGGVYASTSPVSFGALSSGTYKLTGYISNARLIKGTGIYTGNFTPSTTPLTPVTNTQLLLNNVSGAQFADSSTNSYISTATGTPTWNQLSPFATGLGYKNRVYTWTGSGTVTF